MKALLAALVLVPLMARAEPELVTDFKGVYVGAKVDEAQLKRQFDAKCRRQACEGQTTIVGAKARIRIGLGLDGFIDVIYVTFPHSSFESVSLGLVGKFGPATKTSTSTVQNSYGAKGEDQFMAWDRPDGAAIMLSERDSSLAESSVIFRSARHRELQRWNDINNLTDL